jgi:hypothetical protein
MDFESRDPSEQPRPRYAQRNWTAERGRLNDESRWTLSTAERFVLDAIEVHIAANAEGWPTQRRIGLQTGLSERQVRRVVESLLRVGFLIARVVPADGRLPNGQRASVPRCVYARGTPRVLPFPASESASTGVEESTGHHVRLEAARGGHDVREVPDMVSGEWKEELKENKTHTLSEPADAEVDDAGVRAFCSTRLSEEQEQVAARVLEHWRARLWPELPGVLASSERVRPLLARLTDGFTEEDLKGVVEAARVSAWHQAPEQKQRLTIAVLFGKAEMVASLAERARRLAARTPARAIPSPSREHAAYDAAENVASAQRILALLSGPEASLQSRSAGRGFE